MVGRNSPESPNPSWPADDAPPENVLVSASLLTSYGADDSLGFLPQVAQRTLGGMALVRSRLRALYSCRCRCSTIVVAPARKPYCCIAM